MITLLDCLKSMPPYLVRLLARNGSRPLTCYEIAERSGLSSTRVKKISRADNWLNIKTGETIRFMAACGVEVLHLKKPLRVVRATNNLRMARHIRFALSANQPHTRAFYRNLMQKMETPLHRPAAFEKRAARWVKS